MKKALIIYDDQKVEVPIMDTDHDIVLNVENIYDKRKILLYDPGCSSTALHMSKICSIDGDKGVLKYRNYDIENICSKKNFEDLYGLLIYNNNKKYTYNFLTPEEEDCLDTIIISFDPKTIPAICMMQASFSYFSACYRKELLSLKEDELIKKILDVLTTIFVKIHKVFNKEFNNIRLIYTEKKTYAETLYHIIFDNDNQKIDPEGKQDIYKILDIFLSLHAEHEQNASTSSVRNIKSTQANLLDCILAGIIAISGPLHGGANEKCLDMLEDIGKEENVNEYVDQAKKEGKKIMGIGHRVYRNHDPRSSIIKKFYQEYIRKNKKQSQTLKTALALEEYILNDEYFASRKLFPNIDFYSGVVLNEIGINKKLCTSLFVVARSIGWISHWKEMKDEIVQKNRIFRPRQITIK